MTRSSPSLATAALLALSAATACGTAPRERTAAGAAPPAASADTGAPGRGPAPAGAARPQAAEADVRFMQRMIGHHAQALTMTALVPTRARREPIRLLAERIETSQRDEIGLMQRWLRDRGQTVPAANAEHAQHAQHAAATPGSGEGAMPGMLSDAELARLARASGAEFERLFLDFMIRHHEGALTMVREYFATPGAGQEPGAFRLASDVDADQRAEIRRMRTLQGAASDPSGRP